MSVPNFIRPGVKLRSYPAGTHNWILARVKELLAGREETGIIAGDVSTGVRIKNGHTSAIDSPFGILKIDGPLNEPASHANEPHQGLRLKGSLPSAGQAFAILQRAASVDGFADCVVSGLSWVKIDIQSADDTTAGPIDGDTSKLESGSGAATIVWKEDGTGEKWAIVLLGGGGGVGSVPGVVGLLVADVPKATIDATGTDEFAWEIESGILGDTSPDPQATGVLLFDWKRDAASKGEYIDADGVLAPYTFPLEKRTPVYELDPSFVPPDPQTDPPTLHSAVPKWRAAENQSATDIRASADEPVAVQGYVQTIRQGDDVAEVFIITNVMDFRALPGFAKGTAPVGGDDASLQVPYHAGDTDHFVLTPTADCEAT